MDLPRPQVLHMRLSRLLDMRMTCTPPPFLTHLPSRQECSRQHSGDVTFTAQVTEWATPRCLSERLCTLADNKIMPLLGGTHSTLNPRANRGFEKWFASSPLCMEINVLEFWKLLENVQLYRGELLVVVVILEKIMGLLELSIKILYSHYKSDNIPVYHI